MKLYKRTDLHIYRKVWHLTGVMGLWLVLFWLKAPYSRMLVFVLLCLALATELLRRRSIRFNKVVLKVMLPFMRKSEIKGVAGATPLLLAVNLLMFFPPEVASLALLFLAVADPMASLVGVLFGRIKLIAGKSLEGTLAAFCVCAGITWIVHSHLWSEIVIFGIIGAFAELLPIGALDDNFTMPVVTATLLWGYAVLI